MHVYVHTFMHTKTHAYIQGDEIELSLHTFAAYMDTQKDDVPLYIFDEAWAEEGRDTAALLDEYEVPSFFSEDLFKCVCFDMYVFVCVCVCACVCMYV